MYLLCFQSRVLSEDHKAHFEQEIKTLSGALKAQYDQANKEYEGIYIFLLIIMEIFNEHVVSH